MKKLLPVLLSIFSYSCSNQSATSNDLEYVKSNTWVWDNGFKIGEGDFVSFDKADSIVFAMRHDTIFFRNKPRALIQKLNRTNYELFITSIDSKQKGLYRNIEEFTK